MLKIIDRYILKNFLLTFLVLLLAFGAIAIVIDFTEKINDFVKADIPLSDMLSYYIYFIQYIIALLFPIFIFVSVIFFTSKLANRSEIIAMLNSGMSFRRWLRPYFIGAAFISLFLLLANHFLLPHANRQRLQFEEKYIWEKKYSSFNNFHMRIGPQELIYMQSYNPESKTGYRFSYEKVNGVLLLQKISADRIEYDSVAKAWRMHDALVRNMDSLRETLNKHATLTRPFAFTPDDLIERREVKQVMNAFQLEEYIKKEKRKGSENLNEYYIEKYRRTASPFSAFVLSITGACIASKKIRGGSGIHLAIGLAISAIYIFLMQVSTTFAIKGNLHPLLAVWAPNLLFGLLAYLIYRRFSK